MEDVVQMQGVGVPQSLTKFSLNPLIAEFVELDNNPDRWRGTDTRIGWRNVYIVVDSGSSDSCAPSSLVPEVWIRKSGRSRTWQMYSGECGKNLTNFEQSEEGKYVPERNLPPADISRHLYSVTQMCKKGDTVMAYMAE